MGSRGREWDFSCVGERRLLLGWGFFVHPFAPSFYVTQRVRSSKPYTVDNNHMNTTAFSPTYLSYRDLG